MIVKEYLIQNIEELKSKILIWSNKYTHSTILDSNNYKNNKYSKHNYIAGIGTINTIKSEKTANSFNKLKQFIKDNNNYAFGYFSYDLKNDIEDLSSNNNDELKFPELNFYVPEYVLIIKDNKLIIKSRNSNIEQIFTEILETKINTTDINETKYKAKISEKEYIKNVNILKEHIQQGDIYEVNYCQEFYVKNIDVSPILIQKKLLKNSPSPFSVFFKLNTNYLMSASPERFITKQKNKIITQPIKGTIRRDSNKIRDKELINILKNDEKEKSENVMIVDLVRNDLSRIAKKLTVKVEELFGIYTYPQVHQMISTVVAEVENTINPVDIIKNMFPMGSMTGAPKIRAMQLIEQYEQTKRGLFSGAVGYFSPEGDFDFNVIIRSLFYNSENKYLSFQVGSAITIKSDAEKEYQECLIKAKAMLLATNGIIC